MITFRYHVITVIAIFLSLGIGIFIGGSIGQQWLNEKQMDILHRLETKYEEALNRNKMMQERLNRVSHEMAKANDDFLNILVQKFEPTLKGRDVLFLGARTEQTEPLENLLQSIGMHVHHDRRSLNGEVPDLVFSFSGELPHAAVPVIAVGEKAPRWLERYPESREYMSQIPQSISDKWHMLQMIQTLVKEPNVHERYPNDKRDHPGIQ